MNTSDSSIGGQGNALDMQNVGVMRDERWILANINWQVKPGTMAAVLGPNGSGKSTLARIAACHLWPSAGEVSVLGGKFGETSLPELRHRIRLVQAAGPYDIDPSLSAREVVLTGFFGSIGLYDEVTEEMNREADRLIASVGLTHIAKHTYATMSSGERVRSLIARAMATKPELMILDEATSGLDVLAREQVLATVQMLFHQKPRPTVLIITHHVEELPPETSQVLLLQDGRAAAAGTVADVFRPEVLSPVYGCPVEVRQNGGRFYLEVHPSAWGELLGRGKI